MQNRLAPVLAGPDVGRSSHLTKTCSAKLHLLRETYVATLPSLRVADIAHNRGAAEQMLELLGWDSIQNTENPYEKPGQGALSVTGTGVS